MIASTLPASEWRGDISVFESLFSTQPSAVHKNITWTQLSDTVAPKNPQIIERKEAGLYFVPAELRDAPLVGKTFERAKASGKSTFGKMRSANHVGEGTFLKLDLDGVTPAELKHARKKLDKKNIAHILYSTHSNGSKLDNRARLIIPLDKPVAALDYARIANQISKTLFGRVSDKSEGYLHQAAGCAAIHPDRRESAFRIVRHHGYCVDSAATLQEHLTKSPHTLHAPEHTHRTAGELLPTVELVKIAEALTWIDATDYHSWCRTGMMLKAAGLGEHGLAMWLTFSEQAPTTSKQRKNEVQYDPVAMWDRFSPVVPRDVAIATILARAREVTSALVLADLESGVLGTKAAAALEYLHKRHTAYCKQLAAPYVKKTR